MNRIRDFIINSSISKDPAHLQPRSQVLSSLPPLVFQRPREAEKRDPGNEVGASDAWMIGKHVLVTVNQSKQATYSFKYFICKILHNGGSKSRWTWGRFKFFEEIQNCTAEWNVSSVVCSLFRFLFLLFSSSVSPFYESATGLSRHIANYRVLQSNLTRVWRATVVLANLRLFL